LKRAYAQVSAVQLTTRVMDSVMTTTTTVVATGMVVTVVDQVVKPISLLIAQNASARMHHLTQPSAQVSVSAQVMSVMVIVMITTTIADVNGMVVTAADILQKDNSTNTAKSANALIQKLNLLLDAQRKVGVWPFH